MMITGAFLLASPEHPYRLLLLGGSGMALSVIASLIMVIVLPKGFLASAQADSKRRAGGSKRRLLPLIARNVLGWLLIAAGAVLSLPLVPGPGFLLLLSGLFLVDLPGKRKLEQKILGSHRIIGSANRLRRLFGRAPLALAKA